jgi:flagellar motility protein MotE (MotC chaperone)
MKTGYDQYFKKAQKVAAQQGPPPRPVKKTVQTQDAKELARLLRQRVKPRMQKKAKKKTPWKLVGFSLMGLFITALGLWKSDQIEKYAKMIEVTAMGQAYAEEAKSAAPAEKKKDEKGEKSEKGKEEASSETGAKKEYTEEDISHFSKLNERKRELDAREEELNRMEQELATQKAELDKRLGELETTRRNISSVLEEKVQADDKKVDNLVQVYSNMKPQQAAKAFEDMDEGLAIEILGRMKKKNAAEIMNLVKPEKVKILSEKYSGYRRG